VADSCENYKDNFELREVSNSYITTESAICIINSEKCGIMY
jgi:hypothetical protein